MQVLLRLFTLFSMDLMNSKQFFFKLNEDKEKLRSYKRHYISVGIIIFDKLINHLFLIENSVDCSFEIEKEDGLMFILELLLLLNEPRR